MRRGIFLGAVLGAMVACASYTDFDVHDFGAKGDGKTKDTVAIQRAVDAAARAGGGRVVLAQGTFLSGTIWLKSHVEFHIRQGAVLMASLDRADYNRDDVFPQNGSDPHEEWSGSHLIIAHEIEDVSLTGPGRIVGQGHLFFGDVDDNIWPYYKYGLKRHTKDREWFRVGQLIVFIESRDIRVTDLEVLDSPCWTLLLHGCENVTVRGYRVRNDRTMANTDGIDIDCSRNVTMSGCTIDTADDAIAIRAWTRLMKDKTRACENITISDCVLGSCAHAFRIGVGEGDIRNVAVANCISRRSAQAVALCTSYGKPNPRNVHIRNVSFSNCRFLECVSGFEMRTSQGDADSEIRDIAFRGCSFEFFSLGGRIVGQATRRPQDILIDGCDFTHLPRLAEPGEAFSAKVLAERKWVHSDDAFEIERADGVVFRACRFRRHTDPGAWIPPHKRMFGGSSAASVKTMDCDF